MSRPLRLALVVATGACAAAFLAGGASAALWLLFSRTSGEPGQLVNVRTPGRGGALAWARKGPGPRVFVASNAEAATIRSSRDRRLVPLGRLAVDHRGTGRLRFAVPNLTPGEYTTFIHCPSCRRRSGGRALLPAGPWPGPFRITPVLRSCSETQSGDLPSDWTSRAVRAGPLSLYPVPTPAPMPIPGRPGYFRPLKVLTIVAPGSEATLLVPEAQRPYVGLAFTHERGRFGRFSPEMRIKDGLAAITFRTCPETNYPQEHFGGGFVVSRPMCAELEVRVEGREPFPLRVLFGRPC